MAKGNEQTEGIDFLETFAPVVRWTTIRTVIALATRQNWLLQHLDVITAFLNGSISKDIYMTIPPGFLTQGNSASLFALSMAYVKPLVPGTAELTPFYKT